MADFSDASVDSVEISKMPEHIAFIMDGNGRWATARRMPRNAGHRAGAERLREIALECAELGVRHMSVYAFSTENWRRPQGEVNALMSLAVEFFHKYAKDLMKNGIRTRFMGDISALPEKTYKACVDIMELTKDVDGMTLNIGFNYGGRSEIARSARLIAQEVMGGKLSLNDIDESKVQEYLYTAEQPDVDMLVRTGGENRLSGFMLYQCSYAEFFMLDTLWPDFTKEKLEEVICNYKKRNRRFGNAPDPQ